MGRTAARYQEHISMHLSTDPTTRSRRRARGRHAAAPSRRTARGLAVCTLALSFTLAGPAVAQAGDRWDRSGGDGDWNQWSQSWSGHRPGHWSGGGSGSAAPAPAAPAPAAPAPAPAAPAAPAPAAPAPEPAPSGFAPAALSGAPTASSTAYSAWAAHVRPVVAEVVQQCGVSTVLTRPGHSPTQALAADFMVYSDRAKGDAVAAHVIANAARMNVEYVIWQQRIHLIGGSGWQAMADRGSPTANHMDHVHVAFRP
ncbi:hypothetical protein ACI797_01550 [Geodermatophilus sp. SYSU D00691]